MTISVLLELTWFTLRPPPISLHGRRATGCRRVQQLYLGQHHLLQSHPCRYFRLLLLSLGEVLNIGCDLVRFLDWDYRILDGIFTAPDEPIFLMIPLRLPRGIESTLSCAIPSRIIGFLK